MIEVKQINEKTFEVFIDDPTETHHEVIIPEGYYESLSSGKISREELIEKTFEFMMEREDNNMIPRKLDLDTVARSYPEYEQTIKERIGS